MVVVVVTTNDKERRTNFLICPAQRGNEAASIEFFPSLSHFLFLLLFLLFFLLLLSLFC